MNQKVLRAFTASMLALLGARSFISNSNVQSPSKLQGQSNGAVSPEGKIDFSRDVQPIFAERCYVCHGPTQQMVGLRLDQKQSAFRVGSAGPMILPGNSSESQLIRRVTNSKEGFRMPPRVRENTKQDSSLTLKEVFSGRVSPELKLTLDIGKIQLTLPRSKDFWTLQDNDEVVRNKKPISVAGRSGRYVHYRLRFGPFVLAESRLKEPLVIAEGKGAIPPGQIVVAKTGS